jgi:hypothetical protein
MKKLTKTSLALLTVVVLLSALLMSAQAGPPTTAEGLWQYQPFIESARMAGCNTFLDTFENGMWTGTFVGTSTEDGKVVVHCSGFWSFNAIVTFSEVTVEGHSGTLVMSVEGSAPDAVSDWHGRWVILRGTDELATLRGQGTWWGPGAPDVGLWGDIYYGGNIHFEP